MIPQQCWTHHTKIPVPKSSNKHKPLRQKTTSHHHTYFMKSVSCTPTNVILSLSCALQKVFPTSILIPHPPSLHWCTFTTLPHPEVLGVLYQPQSSSSLQKIKRSVHIIIIIIIIMGIQPLGRFGRNQSQVRRLVWLRYAASWASS
jgi:hypothetical protein